MSCSRPAKSLAATLAIAAATSSIALSPTAIPSSLFPLPLLRDFDLSVPKLRLIEIKIDPISGEAGATAQEPISARKVIDSYASTGRGAVCFVVRRPGWVLCREEGIALHELAAQSKEFEGFPVFGITKEINVDDEGLHEFQSKFFPRDLYLDSSFSFYEALGDRKLSVPLRSLLNPFKAYRYIKDMNRRLTSKDIVGNFKGEGLKQGGVIVFDKKGTVKYAYLEETGSELPVADILNAVRAVGGGDDLSKNENSEL